MMEDEGERRVEEEEVGGWGGKTRRGEGSEGGREGGREEGNCRDCT